MDNEKLPREPTETPINWPRLGIIAAIVIGVSIIVYWIIKVAADRHEQPPLPRTLWLPVWCRRHEPTPNANAPAGSPPSYLHDQTPLPAYEEEDHLRRHPVVSIPLQVIPRASLQRRPTGERVGEVFLFGSVQARGPDVNYGIRKGRSALNNRPSVDTLPLYEDQRPGESSSGLRHST
jgi:hypothetical protein